MMLIYLLILFLGILYLRRYLVKRRTDKRYQERFENNVVNRAINPRDNQIVSIYAYQSMQESNPQLSEFLAKLNKTVNKLKGEMVNKVSEEPNFFYIRQQFENGNNMIYQFDTKITVNDGLYNKITQYYYYIGNNRFTVNLFIVNMIGQSTETVDNNFVISNIYYDIVELQKYRNYDDEYNLYDKYYHYVDM